jgi:hypothetical protein
VALAEGLRRIRQIGKGILWAGFVFVAIAVALFLNMLGSNHSFLGPVLLICGAIGIHLSILGVTVLLAVWITEGFLAPRVPPNP